MTPEERQVISGIFERLRSAEGQYRDPEAERYIAELVRNQPYAPYTLAQSVYVQEQALENQHRRIEALEAELEALKTRPAPPQGGGFLSGLFGGGAGAPAQPSFGARREAGYAPAAPAAPAGGPWGRPAAPQPALGSRAAAAPASGGGMGFLGTAASAAAGVAGGMMLGNVLSSALGLGQGNRAPAESGFLNDSVAQDSRAQDSRPQDSQAQNSHYAEPAPEEEEAADEGGYGDDGGGFDA